MNDTQSPIEGESGLRDKLFALQSPQAYPHACDNIRLIETHFAAIFLTGEFAYKLKKPVQIERMDLRELTGREHACREELRLNRRLAADVYLAVVPLTIEAGGTYRIEGRGEIVDWLVKMRVLPSERMLDCAIATNRVICADVRTVARLLAHFYREQPPQQFSGAEYLARLRQRVEEAWRELRAPDLALNTPPIESAIERQRTFLTGYSTEVEARATLRIVEGHGDLRPEHVFLGSPVLKPCIIDCLEFDRDLRIFDPLEELAFFALECSRLNATWIGEEFVAAYRDITQDYWPTSLFAFYRRQRALTRAKIAAWHLRDPSVAEMADWRALAHSYVCDALQTA